MREETSIMLHIIKWLSFIAEIANNFSWKRTIIDVWQVA